MWDHSKRIFVDGVRDNYLVSRPTITSFHKKRVWQIKDFFWLQLVIQKFTHTDFYVATYVCLKFVYNVLYKYVSISNNREICKKTAARENKLSVNGLKMDESIWS